MGGFKDVVDPSRFCSLEYALAVFYVMEFELAGHGDGNFLGAEIARVGDVHLSVYHLEL